MKRDVGKGRAILLPRWGCVNLAIKARRSRVGTCSESFNSNNLTRTDSIVFASLQERSFRTGSGIVVYWADSSAGADAPWLVFLPGLTADHALFDAQVNRFSGEANCLVWDAPAHGRSRPYPLDFSMGDCACILHSILEAEGVVNPVLVGRSLGGYLSQAFIDLYPGEASGFISIDSAPLQRRHYPTWEVRALRHTKGMFQPIPWAWLKPLVAWGAAVTARGKAGMRSFMGDYAKREYVELTAHGYRMLADAIDSERAYDIDCPALLLCGEKDRVGEVGKLNRKWAADAGIPLDDRPQGAGQGHGGFLRTHAAQARRAPQSHLIPRARVSEILTQVIPVSQTTWLFVTWKGYLILGRFRLRRGRCLAS